MVIVHVSGLISNICLYKLRCLECIGFLIMEASPSGIHIPSVVTTVKLEQVYAILSKLLSPAVRELGVVPNDSLFSVFGSCRLCVGIGSWDIVMDATSVSSAKITFSIDSNNTIQKVRLLFRSNRLITGSK